jgi:hypothetical protein
MFSVTVEGQTVLKNKKNFTTKKIQTQDTESIFLVLFLSSNTVCESRQEAECCCVYKEDNGERSRAIASVVDDVFAVKLRLKKDTHKLS